MTYRFIYLQVIGGLKKTKGSLVAPSQPSIDQPESPDNLSYNIIYYNIICLIQYIYIYLCIYTYVYQKILQVANYHGGVTYRCIYRFRQQKGYQPPFWPLAGSRHAVVVGLHHGVEQLGAATVFHGDAFRRHRPVHFAAGLALCLRVQTRSAVADDA